jgi:hypothetical protein
MGDMSGGGGGGIGKAGGGMGGGMPADTSGGLGMGGGFDPTGGMGGSFDPTGGGVTPDMFGMADPTMQMQQAMGGTQALTQPPITDQPLAATPAPGQAPQAPPPPPPQLDKAQALFGGPSSHPDWGFGNQVTQGPSATPGGTQEARLFDQETGKTIRTDAPVVNEPYKGLDPATNLGGQKGPSIELPELNQPSIELPELNQTPADVTGSRYDAGPGSQLPEMIGKPSIEIPQNQPSLTSNVPMPRPAPGMTAPSVTAETGIPPDVTGPGPQTPAQPGMAGGGAPGATSQVTPPGTAAPAGTGPQSPLEQLVGQFLHMLFGGGRGGIGPLEQLIARMVGLDPRRLFPQFYGGGMNRPAGPGYFPPGTVGGRSIAPGAAPGTGAAPGAQSAPPQTPGPQAPGPQAPGTPSPSSALPPSRRREFDPTLPGPPYTAQSRDQPPPWYRPDQNPATRQSALPPSPNIPRPPAPVPGKVLGRAGGMDLPAAPGSSPQLSTVDPRLRDMLGAAKNKFEERNPGYRVMATSGYRGGKGQSQHGQRDAIDVQIFDANGNAISNRGGDPTGLYRQYARLTYGVQRAFYPELNGRFAWGGAFGTQLGGGGPPDLMHFDLGGERGHWTGSRPSTMGPLSLLRGYSEPAA